jgi:hypothetical protein
MQGLADCGEIVVIALAWIGSTGLLVQAGIFYILTLRNALWKCVSESRTMNPGKLCLLQIPLFNLGWHFCGRPEDGEVAEKRIRAPQFPRRS